MDIRKPNSETKVHLNSDDSGKKTVKFKAGIVNTADAKLILPPAIQTKLSALTTKYGIPFDLSNVQLDGKMAENVKAIRQIADVVSGDAQLLPELLKQIRRLMKA